jgi:hypothetical protein
MEEVMYFAQIVNATPQSLRIYDETGTVIVLELPHNPIDPTASAGERAVRLSDAEVSGVRIPVHGTTYGQVSGLPEPQDGVFYVVALPVALAAPDRNDLLVWGPAVRDDPNLLCRDRLTALAVMDRLAS